MREKIHQNSPFDLRSSDAELIAATLTGSHAFGIETGGSDEDVIGIILPPAERILGLQIWEVWHDVSHDVDVTFYSPRRAAELIAKCGPNILPLVYANQEAIQDDSDAYKALRAIGDDFRCLKAIRALLGNAEGHIRAAKASVGKTVVTERRPLIELYGYDTKAAAHALLCVYQAADWLGSGTFHVKQPRSVREHVLSVRQGNYELSNLIEEVALMGEGVESGMQYAQEVGGWPDQPKTERLEEWLLETVGHGLCRTWSRSRADGF